MTGHPCKTTGCQNVSFDHSSSHPFCGKCAAEKDAEERTRLKLKAVREGTVVGMPTSDRAGFIQKPAPFDGVLISGDGWVEFVEAGRLERELRRIGRAGEVGPPRRKQRRVM